ncbi:hypothetical protein SNARM312S_03028 [Streptomyces narbonensis]
MTLGVPAKPWVRLPGSRQVGGVREVEVAAGAEPRARFEDLAEEALRGARRDGGLQEDGGVRAEPGGEGAGRVHYEKRVEAERESQRQPDDLTADAARLGAPDIVPINGQFSARRPCRPESDGNLGGAYGRRRP